ncbi:MAG: potassium channel family protein [Thermodesulfobacteriota bacterium]
MRHSLFFHKARYAGVLIFSLICLFLFGTFGYMFLEDVSPIKGLFLTIGALTTVAPFELSDMGRIFTILVLLLGFGIVAATGAYIGGIFLDGKWLENYRRRKVQKELKTFKDHYIVCGHGQMGQIVAAELFKKEISIIVIDNDEKSIDRCMELGIPHLRRDAMEEENLVEAGVERAKGVISVVNRDADNLFIVLSARALNPELFICARASSRGVEKKLYRAGADHVVSPYASAAMRIAQNILRPTITDFLELALTGKGVDLTLEELNIPEDSCLADKSLMDSNIREDFDLIIVAIRRKDGRRVYNPSSLELIHGGDILIAIGPKENMDRFYKKIYEK